MTWTLKSFKNFHFNVLLLSKVYNVWAKKKYRGVIFDDIEEWCKIWRKTGWWFEKLHEKFGKFSPEHLGVSKLGLCWDHFVQSRKGMTVLFIEELCVMEIKNNSKFKEELTCAFKNDTRNLANLHRLK